MVAREFRHHRRELVRGVGQRNLVLKTPKGVDRALRAVRAPLPIHRERDENLRVLEQREMKRFRQYTDDNVRRVIDRDCVAQRSSGTNGAREVLGHNGHAGCDCGVLALDEVATSRHPDAVPITRRRG